jgi:hypothetical protein
VFGEDCGGVWVALEFDAARGVILCCFAVVMFFTLILQVIGGATAAMAGTHPQVGQALLPLFLLSYFEEGRREEKEMMLTDE